MAVAGYNVNIILGVVCLVIHQGYWVTPATRGALKMDIVPQASCWDDIWRNPNWR